MFSGLATVDNFPSVKIMDIKLERSHVSYCSVCITVCYSAHVQQFQKHDALSSVLRSLASLVSSDSVARCSLDRSLLWRSPASLVPLEPRVNPACTLPRAHRAMSWYISVCRAPMYKIVYFIRDITVPPCPLRILRINPAITDCANHDHLVAI